MNNSGSSKRQGPDDYEDPFSQGLVTATGERVFLPIRKMQRMGYTETRKNIYQGCFQSKLTNDESILVRKQNHIQVIGDDLCGPILQFQDLELPEFVTRRLFYLDISVTNLNSP